MDAFGQEIQRLKHEGEALLHKEEQQPTAEALKDKQERLFRVLFELANRIRASDPDLTVTVGAGRKPKLTVGFIDAHFSTPRYTLTSAWNGEDVDLTVSDGHWTKSSNYLGLWGSWTDAKAIHSGPMLEASIREAVERSFLEWYRTVKTNRLAGLDLQ